MFRQLRRGGISVDRAAGMVHDVISGHFQSAARVPVVSSSVWEG